MLKTECKRSGGPGRKLGSDVLTEEALMNRRFNEGTIGPSHEDLARDVGVSRACSSWNPKLR